MQLTLQQLTLAGGPACRAPRSHGPAPACRPSLCWLGAPGSLEAAQRSAGTPAAGRVARRAAVAPRAAAAAAAVEELVLQPISSIEGRVKLPGSKSLSNRILLLAALADGVTVVDNILDSEDIRYMVGALKDLGVELLEDWEHDKIVVKGCAGRFPSGGGTLFLGAGVVACALGVDAKCTLGTGCPPVEVKAAGLPSGKVELSGKVSSQYLTALLMAAPLATSGAGVEIKIRDELISQPYVDMTVRLMERFGVEASAGRRGRGRGEAMRGWVTRARACVCVRAVNRLDGLQHLHIPAGQTYRSPGNAYVEGDASSASYFLAGATMTGSRIVVEGCGSESLQGDVRFAEVMGQMGATVEWAPYAITLTGPPRGQLKAVDVNCNDIPDAAMTLAIVAELTKLGAKVEEGRDFCVITPPAEVAPGVAIETILDPGCTRKTFPTYFDASPTFGWVLKSVAFHDPLEAFCAENPDADECRVYDD
eukprot:scaffold4.g5031.t1